MAKRFSIVSILCVGAIVCSCVSQNRMPAAAAPKLGNSVDQRKHEVVRTAVGTPVEGRRSSQTPVDVYPRSSGCKSWSILQQAVDAYKGFDFGRVIRLTEQLLSCEDSSRAEMVVAVVLAGASAYLLNDRELAEGYFIEALGLDPHIQLNSSIYPTAILQFFSDVKNHR